MDTPEDKLLKCHHHPDREAVGACLACGKTLCETCGEWFNGRFYCVSCYANIEIMLAQAETPKLHNIEWHHAPGNIIGIIFFSFCLIFTGFYFLVNRKPAAGIILLVFGWIFQAVNIPLVRHTPALSGNVKTFFTAFLYISLTLVLLSTILLTLFRLRVFHF